LVNDVRTDAAKAYYVELSATTRSNLAIPLLDDADAPVGVLNVESDQSGAFDCRDKRALQGLALVMVIVLQIGRKHGELLKARGEARARLILAWLGFAANHGWHTSRAHLATIRGAALNIQQELTKRLGPAVPIQVLDNLRLVEILCKEMVHLDLAPPLDSLEARGSIPVNEFLREFSFEVQNRRDQCFKVQEEFGLADEVRVSVNVPWFRCAFKILVDNAARELAHVGEDRRVLRLISRSAQSAVEIVVEDQGRGIPPEIQRYLGKTVVPGAMGVGVGYLIAQAVAETYDGTLTFQTGEWGTRMIIGLPVCEGGGA
jgi:K+-sensing histidine kinase KdpD